MTIISNLPFGQGQREMPILAYLCMIMVERQSLLFFIYNPCTRNDMLEKAKACLLWPSELKVWEAQ